jgi:hypothetical protein
MQEMAVKSMISQAGGESAAEKFLSSIDQVIEHSVDEGFLAFYLNWQLGQWEAVSRRLELWLDGGGEGENPYTPAIDYVQAQCVVGAIQARITELRAKILDNIALANEALEATVLAFPQVRGVAR